MCNSDNDLLCKVTKERNIIESVFAIEYFIKKNKNVNKITKVKMYETHQKWSTYTFTSEPFYENRETLIEQISNV